MDYLDILLGRSAGYPGLSLGALGIPTRTRDYLPEISEEEQQSAAGWIAENLLGGLGYLGSLIDKPARAIRGFLGGKPQELLAAIPFSDNLGFTKYEDQVTGRDLLARLGWVKQRRPYETFSWDDAYGIAAEIALDPLTYFAMPLTAAGKAAKQTGKMAKGLRQQLAMGQRGVGFHIPLTATLSGTEGIYGTLLSGPKAVQGYDYLKAVGAAPFRGADYLTELLTGVKPFSAIGGAFNRGIYQPMTRLVDKFFDPDVIDAYTPEAQATARIVSQFQRTWREDILGMTEKLHQQLRDIVGRDPAQAPEKARSVLQALVQSIEESGNTRLYEKLRQESIDRIYNQIIRRLPEDEQHLADIHNIKMWRQGYQGLNPSNQKLYELYTDQFDRMMVERMLPEIQNQPSHRLRYMQEVESVFGPQAKYVMPIMDSVAKLYARNRGVNIDDYYANLRAVRGGQPGKEALYHSYEVPNIQGVREGDQVKTDFSFRYYSRMREVIDEKVGKSIDSRSLINLLKKHGIKDEEIDRSGLRGLTGQLSKDEITKTLDDNAIVLTETRFLEENNTLLFSDATVPFLTDRKELVLAAPDQFSRIEVERLKELKAKIAEYEKRIDDLQSVKTDSKAERKAIKRKIEAIEYKIERLNNRRDRIFQGHGDAFFSGHFLKTPDEPRDFIQNYIAHARVGTMMTQDGRKMLYVQEMQSDLHQKGARVGYRPQGSEKKKFDPINDPIGLLGDYPVPDLPFKDNWKELLARRLITYAAKNDYDGVVIVPSFMTQKTSGARSEWDHIVLSNVVTDADKKIVSADVQFKSYQGDELDKFYAGTRVGNFESAVPMSTVDLRKVNEDQLARFVGKKGVDMIKSSWDQVSQAGEKTAHIFLSMAPDQKAYHGSKLAASSTKTLYDIYENVLPRTFEKIISKHGGKVEHFHVRPQNIEGILSGRAPNSRAALQYLEALSVPHIGFVIPESLKKEVLEKGIPLFQRNQRMVKGSFEVTDGIRIIRAFKNADVSTLIHETAHDWLHMMKHIDSGLAEDVARILGAPSWEKITREQSEQFARAAEVYMRRGKAPHHSLKEAFQKLREWLIDIYRRLVGTPMEKVLSPQLKSFFDDLIGKAAGDMIPYSTIGNKPLPIDFGTMAALTAVRDRVNRSGSIGIRADGTIFGMPSLQTQAVDRSAIVNRIMSDPDFGPKSIKNAASRAQYEKLLNDWQEQATEKLALKKSPEGLTYYEPQSQKSYEAIVNSPYGSQFVNSLARIANTPEFKRVFGDAPMFEVKPPVKRSQIEWAEKNLSPQEQQIFYSMRDTMKNWMQQLKEIEKLTGSRGGELADYAIDYLFRQQIKTTDPDAIDRGIVSAMESLRAAHRGYKQRIEMFQNIPGGTQTIDEWVTDPRLSGRNRLFSNEEVVNHLLKELTGTDQVVSGHPAIRQAIKLADWLYRLPEKHATEKVPFFSVDIPNLFLQRAMGAGRVQEAALALIETAHRAARPTVDFQTANKPHMTLYELATRMNLTGYDSKGSIITRLISAGPDQKLQKTIFGQAMDAAESQRAQQGIVSSAAKELLEMAIEQPAGRFTLSSLRDFAIDLDVAKDVLKFHQSVTAPESVRPVVQAYDYINNLTKGLLTRLWPAYHTRNMFFGLFSIWRSTGIDRDALARSWKLMRGNYAPNEQVIAGLTRDELMQELVSQRVAFKQNMGALADIEMETGDVILRGIRRPPEEPTGRTALGDLFGSFRKEFEELKEDPAKKLNLFRGVAGAGSPKDTLLLLQTISNTGQWAEDFIRVGHYLTLRKQGFTPRAAADEVAKYQIDYSRLTRTERSLFRRIWPWYSFSRGVLPPILDDLAKQPMVVTTPMRVVTGGRPEGEFTPQWIAEGATLPLMQLPTGEQRYITSFGLPYEDESVRILGSLMRGDVTRAMEQTVGAMMPIIKGPLELLFDRQLYSGRPMSELRPANWATLGGLLDERQARMLTQVTMMSPISRAGSTASRFLDERKDFLSQFLNFATGVSVSDVDVQRAKDAQAKQVIEKLLKGQPGVRRYSEIYVPIANLPMLTEEQKRLYALYLDANRRLHQVAKERRQQDLLAAYLGLSPGP